VGLELLLWLALLVGKMNQILQCDWLPKWARWGYLAHSGLHVPAVSCTKIVFFFHIINPLLTMLVWTRWLGIGLVLCYVFMDVDSVLVHKHAKKKNLAQPSWPLAWSIIHIFYMFIIFIIWWIKTCTVIGYLSGQDEAQSCVPGTTRHVLQEKFPWKLYNKSFIDWACSVKMAWYLPHSYFAASWTSTPSQSTNMQKKNLTNIQPSWPHTWSITYMYIHISLIHTAFFSLMNDAYLVHPKRKGWL